MGFNNPLSVINNFSPTTVVGGAALGIYQPETYGAVGDDSVDNVTALASCILDAESKGGGKIMFGPGIFRTSGTMLIASNNITVSGVLGGTTLRTTHASAPVIDFGNNIALFSFLGVNDIVIDSDIVRTGGAFIRFRKTALSFVYRVRLDGAYYGVDIVDGQVTVLSDMHIINCVAGVGEAVRANSTGTGSNLYLNRVNTDAPVGAQPRCGLSVKAWDGVFLTDSQFNHSGTGFIIEPGAGTFCDHIFAVNCSFDTNSGNGLTTVAGAGVARRGWFLGCWFGSNDNNGVQLDGGALGFSFVQPKLFNNGAYGLILTSGTYLTITDPQASGNSRGGSGNFDAILISDNMSYVTIEGGLCRPFSGFANTQRRGITINPGCDHITIRDTDCSGNVNAVGVANLASGTATDILISGVRGYKNKSKGTAIQVAASGFIYVGHGLDVTPGLKDIRVTPCTDLGAVSKFYVSNPAFDRFQLNTAGAPGVDVTWSWEVDCESI